MTRMHRAAPEAVAARMLFAAILSTAGPTAAQEAAIDPGVVEACVAGAAPGETAPDCLGAAAGACSARPDRDTTIGIVECVAADTAAWDASLNWEYRATREALGGAGEVGIDAGQALLDARRAWIARRDAECALTHARWQGGTIRSVAAANCTLGFTATRSIELRDLRGGG